MKTFKEIKMLDLSREIKGFEKIIRVIRSEDVKQRYIKGETLEEIGRIYLVSRERIRQILVEFGIAAANGGQVKRIKENEKKRKADRGAYLDSKYMEIYGCTYEELKELNGENLTRSDSLAGKYRTQKLSAYKRGIEWKITFPEYAKIWKESGKIWVRGRSKGKYCMGRKGDIGPYANDNVEILEVEQNTKQKLHKYISRAQRDELGYSPKIREARDLIASGVNTPRKLADRLGVCYNVAYSYFRKIQVTEPHLVPKEPE